MNDKDNSTISEQDTPITEEQTPAVSKAPTEPQKTNGQVGAPLNDVGMLALGELIVSGITAMVYLLLFSVGVFEENRLLTIIMGSLLGSAVIVLNFLILTVSVNRAVNKYIAIRGTAEMDDDAAEKFAAENSMIIQNAMTRSYIIRSVLMLGVLVCAFLISNVFNVIATLIPLVCYRPIIYITELIKNKRR